jgi:hypothetical protein
LFTVRPDARSHQPGNHLRLRARAIPLRRRH